MGGGGGGVGGSGGRGGAGAGGGGGAGGLLSSKFEAKLGGLLFSSKFDSGNLAAVEAVRVPCCCC